jgi:hypothetical protein
MGVVAAEQREGGPTVVFAQDINLGRWGVDEGKFVAVGLIPVCCSVLPCVQERFIKHVVQFLADPRCNDEIRRVWIGYWTQCDEKLGQRLTKQLQAMGCM